MQADQWQWDVRRIVVAAVVGALVEADVPYGAQLVRMRVHRRSVHHRELAVDVQVELRWGRLVYRRVARLVYVVRVGGGAAVVTVRARRAGGHLQMLAGADRAHDGGRRAGAATVRQATVVDVAVGNTMAVVGLLVVLLRWPRGFAAVTRVQVMREGERTATTAPKCGPIVAREQAIDELYSTS